MTKVDQPSFLTMRGMEVLGFIRDGVADEAFRKRRFIEQCEQVAGGVTPPEDWQRVRTLEAAAQLIQFVITMGQDALVARQNDKTKRFPDWITRCANNARTSLVEPLPDTEDVTAG